MSESFVRCHNRYGICKACEKLINEQKTAITLEDAQQMLDLLDVGTNEPLFSFGASDSDNDDESSTTKEVDVKVVEEDDRHVVTVTTSAADNSKIISDGNVELQLSSEMLQRYNSAQQNLRTEANRARPGKTRIVPLLSSLLFIHYNKQIL